MSSLPGPLEQYLVETLLGERAWAFLDVDRKGLLRGVEGEFAWFGLEGARRGEKISERLAFLGDFRPSAGREKEVLPRLELVPGRSTDLHLVPHEGGVHLLFLDATREAEKEWRFQQRGNEWSLVLRAWGVAIFERTDQGTFQLLGLAPPWMRALGIEVDGAEEVAEHFPFLENFLEDAASTWEQRQPPRRWSGIWVEEDARGREWYLEAGATTLEDGRRILLIQSADRRYRADRRILQEARSRSLDLQRLRSEIDKKETLLHCIIHDLKGPLSGMVGSMSLVKSPGLDADQTRELLELGLEQARHQEFLIRSILDAFVADVQSLEYFESELDVAPDLFAGVQAAGSTYRAAYEQNNVGLDLDLPAEQDRPCKVVGDASRLERVLCNLLENALRHSPSSGRVRVAIEDRGKVYRTCVEDQGPGIDADREATLFRKFGGGGARGGASGLGLFFCRSTLETWGGSIGYERIPGGGSRFWFELPKPF